MGAARLILGSLLCAALANVASSTVQRGPVQYQKQTEYGTYKFGYDTGDQFRQEHRGFDGVVHGRYGYKDANGKLRYVEYSAGPFGYRVKGDTGADDVPRGEPLGNSKTYKAPTDHELTDLQGGLAEIKRQQLFGVPVQPYVKGYHQDAPPPQQVKEVIVRPPPPPPPKIEQQIIVQPPPPKIEQVILSPPPARVEQVVIPPPKQVIVTPQVFVEPVKTTYVKGYQPPIVTPPKSEIRVIPQKQHQQIFQHPVQDHYTKGYVVATPAPKTIVVQQQPQQVVVHQPPKQIVIQQQPQQVVVHQPPKQVVVHQPPQQIIVHQQPKQVIVQQPVVVQKPVVLVQHPIKSIKSPPQVVKVVQHPQIFQRPVEDHYTKGYVAPTQAPIIRVVPTSRPYTKGYVAHPSPPRVVVVSRPKEIVYTKGHVKSTPQRVVVVKQPQRTKTYVPPRQQVVVVTSRPRIFEQPVQPYVKGYVQPQTKNPLRRVQPCDKCRGQSSRGTFPQSVAREYVFSRPVQPYAKGYVGTPRPSSTKGKPLRRVQPSGSRGEQSLVWIPAPDNRYRDNTEYYEQPPPAYAYAPY